MWNKGGWVGAPSPFRVQSHQLAWLATLVISFAEIRPSDTRAPLHDVQTIQILRLVSSYELWISWRGTGFDITRRQPDRYHEDEERELCVEVRVSSFQFFSPPSFFL
jgi:hypothetical protein